MWKKIGKKGRLAVGTLFNKPPLPPPLCSMIFVTTRQCTNKFVIALAAPKIEKGGEKILRWKKERRR